MRDVGHSPIERNAFVDEESASVQNRRADGSRAEQLPTTTPDRRFLDARPSCRVTFFITRDAQPDQADSLRTVGPAEPLRDANPRSAAPSTSSALRGGTSRDHETRAGPHAASRSKVSWPSGPAAANWS